MLDPLPTALLTFASLVLCGLVGLALRLDDRHVGQDTRESVRLMQGIVGSMAALLLGLLVAASTDRYRDQGEALIKLAAEVATLDRMLLEYGPAAVPARVALRASVTQAVDEMRREGVRRASPITGPSPFDAVLALTPETPRESFLHQNALSQILAVARARTGIVTAEQHSAVQMPLLTLLVVWFGMLFLAINLFARRSLVVMIATAVGSATVGSAIFLIMEFDRPFGGLLGHSAEILLQVLRALPPP